MGNLFYKHREIGGKNIVKKEREREKEIPRLQSKRHIFMDPNEREAGPEASQCSQAEHGSETEKQRAVLCSHPEAYCLEN